MTPHEKLRAAATAVAEQRNAGIGHPELADVDDLLDRLDDLFEELDQVDDVDVSMIRLIAGADGRVTLACLECTAAEWRAHLAAHHSPATAGVIARRHVIEAHEPTRAAGDARHALDAAIAAARPSAGGRVAELLDQLGAALADLDAQRAAAGVQHG